MSLQNDQFQIKPKVSDWVLFFQNVRHNSFIIPGLVPLVMISYQFSSMYCSKDLPVKQYLYVLKSQSEFNVCTRYHPFI